MTTLEEILAPVRALPREDKIKLVELLNAELRLREPTRMLPDHTYEVWSPWEAADSAAILQKLLEKRKTAP